MLRGELRDFVARITEPLEKIFFIWTQRISPNLFLVVLLFFEQFCFSLSCCFEVGFDIFKKIRL